MYYSTLAMLKSSSIRGQ